MSKTASLLAGVAMAAAAGAAIAADFGTAEQARALMIRAMAEVKINQANAIAKFNRADGGFMQNDLYVFCFNGSDGKVIANADKAQLGRDVRSIRDVTGAPFGDAMFRDAKQTQLRTFSYKWPRPGDTRPVDKESYVSRLGGIACGVGYYK